MFFVRSFIYQKGRKEWDGAYIKQDKLKILTRYQCYLKLFDIIQVENPSKLSTTTIWDNKWTIVCHFFSQLPLLHPFHQSLSSYAARKWKLSRVLDYNNWQHIWPRKSYKNQGAGGASRIKALRSWDWPSCITLLFFCLWTSLRSSSPSCFLFWNYIK